MTSSEQRWPFLHFTTHLNLIYSTTSLRLGRSRERNKPAPGANSLFSEGELDNSSGADLENPCPEGLVGACAGSAGILMPCKDGSVLPAPPSPLIFKSQSLSQIFRVAVFILLKFYGGHQGHGSGVSGWSGSSGLGPWREDCSLLLPHVNIRAKETIAFF